MNKTGAIILAAGSSLRLGSPKQLLPYQNKFLIQHIVGEVVKAKLHPVVVVTGANEEQVSSVIDKEEIKIIFNEHWHEGMASGIVKGLSQVLLLDNRVEAVLITVCDQPFVSAPLLHQLSQKRLKTEKSIVACTYLDTIGTPVLFGRKYFEHLKKLEGDEGARGIIRRFENDVATIAFPQGSIDIDTKEDYQKLLSAQE